MRLYTYFVMIFANLTVIQKQMILDRLSKKSNFGDNLDMQDLLDKNGIKCQTEILKKNMKMIMS